MMRDSLLYVQCISHYLCLHYAPQLLLVLFCKYYSILPKDVLVVQITEPFVQVLFVDLWGCLLLMGLVIFGI